MRSLALVLALAAASAAFAAEPPPWATKDLRAGIIGTDTSHVPAFTGLFQSHPEWRIKVVAAFKGGQPRSAHQRQPRRGLRQDDPRQVRRRAGRQHRGAAAEGGRGAAGERGRPAAPGPGHARAEGRQTPVHRQAAGRQPGRRPADRATGEGDGHAVFQLLLDAVPPGHPPAPRQSRRGQGASRSRAARRSTSWSIHPDLFFYGIHGVEALYAVMGTGLRQRLAEDRGRRGRDHRQMEGRADRRLPRRWSRARRLPMIRVWGTEGTTDSTGPERLRRPGAGDRRVLPDRPAAGRSGRNPRNLRVHDGRPSEQGPRRRGSAAGGSAQMIGPAADRSPTPDLKEAERVEEGVRCDTCPNGALIAQPRVAAYSPLPWDNGTNKIQTPTGFRRGSVHATIAIQRAGSPGVTFDEQYVWD